jgi:histidyl-tRNA synthetase
LKCADQRGFRVALIAGSREFQAEECQVKDLRAGQSETCSLADGVRAAIEAIRRILAS